MSPSTDEYSRRPYHICLMTIVSRFIICSTSTNQRMVNPTPLQNKLKHNTTTMKHADGIEVYLRPSNNAQGDRRFSEIDSHLTGPDFDGRYQQRYIPYHDCAYSVVIRFSNAFKVMSASGLHYVVIWRSRDSKAAMHSCTSRRSLLCGQQITVTPTQILGEVGLPVFITKSDDLDGRRTSSNLACDLANLTLRLRGASSPLRARAE